MQTYTTLKEVLLAFITEMPHGVVSNKLTLEEIKDIVENFLKGHGIEDDTKK